MKILLIIPPPTSPVSPYLSAPLLCGQLVANGFDAKTLDLSVEFFDWVLNKNFLLNQYNLAKSLYDSLDTQGKTVLDKEFKSYPYELKKTVLKKYYIENFLKTDAENLELISEISDIIESYKNKDVFYDFQKSKNLLSKINKAFDIAMLPFAPNSLMFHSYKNPLYKVTYSALKKQALDNEDNIFYKFFKDKIKEHKINEYDLILISIPNETMLLPALTLMYQIKENSSAKIAIGGNIITRIDNELKNIPDAFNCFYDYVMIGTGEASVIKLAKYVQADSLTASELRKIAGLIYTDQGIVKWNNPDVKYNINKSHNLSLNGIDLTKYYTPDIIMPIQMTKGCYWGKCKFCGLHYPPRKYSIKNVVKVVDEIEYLNKNYNINIFEFVDEAIHPKYLSKLADEILKRQLNIKYCLLTRLDKGFNKKLCERLYLSGLRLVEVGYETASNRIFNKINKGIDFNNRMNIVKMFADANIFTYLYAIIGYPTETQEEAIATVNVAEQYKDIVDAMFIHKFWLDKKAPVFKNYKKSGISKILENNYDVFNQKCQFCSNDGMNDDEIKYVYNLYLSRNNYLQNSHLIPDEYFFLYAIHFGREKFKNLINRLILLP